MAGNRATQAKKRVTPLDREDLAAWLTRKYGDIIVPANTLLSDSPVPGSPPFKGLHPYTAADEAIFCGREGMVKRIEARLQQSDLVALVGASGSGKSSLIGAGLTPVLRRQQWLVRTITPTDRPLHELAATLFEAAAGGPTTGQLAALLRAGPQVLPQLGERLLKKNARRRLLLAVDQFEELFTVCRDDAERRAFLDMLGTMARADVPITILLSIRARFYEQCLADPGLGPHLAGKQETLSAPAGEDLVEVIAEPARRARWYFAGGLIEQILEDMGARPVRLPLLSQALYETWRRRQGRVMTLTGYREAGKIESAIAHAAEQTVRAVPGQAALVKKIFITLALPEETAPHRSRSATITELTQLGPPSEVTSALTRMVRDRLITIDHGHVRFSHGALITHWPRLRHWLATRQEWLRFKQRLARDARTWEESAHDPRALYRGAHLAEALAWREHPEVAATLPSLAHAFLKASESLATQEARQEETRQIAAQIAESEAATRVSDTRETSQTATRGTRRRAPVGALMLLVGLLLIFGGVGLRAIEAAQAQARAARAGELAARAAATLPRQPLAALALAWKAADATYSVDGTITVEARAALQGTLDLPLPVRRFQAHLGPVTNLAFNPAGDRLLTTGLDGHARLWDLAGNQVADLAVPGRGIVSGGFNAQGDRLFTLDQAGRVIIWDEQGRLLAQFAEEESRITVAAFHPDGDRILTGSMVGLVRIWNINGRQLLTLPRLPGPVTVARWHPLGQRILTASQAEAALWDLEGKQLTSFRSHTSGITDANFSPEGDLVVSAGHDRSARVWDLQGRELARLADHEDSVWSAEFGPRGESVVTASGDRTARSWDIHGALRSQVGTHQSGVALARFDPGGNRILTIGWNGKAFLWDRQGVPLVDLTNEEPEGIGFARFDVTGTWLATGGDGGMVRLWKVGGDTAVFAHGGRARLAPAGGEAVAAASQTDAALWAAGRARLLNSPACLQLFEPTHCPNWP